MTSSAEGGGDPREELEHFRTDIEEIDRALIQLLAKRVRLGRRIGSLKRAAGLPVLDPQREAEVIRGVAEIAREVGLPSEPVREIYWQIIALARRTQIEEG